MLGLTKGDRLAQANGIALQQPDDVIGAVLRPLAQSQPVRIGGSRGGQPRDVLVVNATACP
jgi:type II secretory pathway component PulC